jgi:hypothetical protein
MTNYTSVMQSLGYSNEQQFRDALVSVNINPRQAQSQGLTEAQARKIPRITGQLEAAQPVDTYTPRLSSTEEEPTVAISQIQAKLGVDAETMVRLCKDFGLSGDRPLPQSEAMALCQLAQEQYGLQIEGDLNFLSERQSLLWQQQQGVAYQLGYLQEASINNAYNSGRIKARIDRLGKQESEVRAAQEQVFSLLGQAGKSLKKQEQTAAQAHQTFSLGLWA